MINRPVVYFVLRTHVTDDEPLPGWYFESERAEDSAPVIRGPFESRLEAMEFTE